MPVAAGVILLSRLDRHARSPSSTLVNGVHSLSEVMRLVVTTRPIVEKPIRQFKLLRVLIRRKFCKKRLRCDQVEVAQHFTRDAGPHGAAGGLTSRLR
jgi:hypothetical protein